jgi:recombinational DNA repair protein (RecF pathway)
MYLGQYAAELVGFLIEEHDAHPELFDRLGADAGDLATPRLEEAFLAFELDLLRETGYLAEMSACVECSSTLSDREARRGSRRRGAGSLSQLRELVHDRMTDRRPAATYGAIDPAPFPRSDGSAHRLPRLTRHQTDPINRLLAEHVEHTLGRRLRLHAYVLGNGNR